MTLTNSILGGLGQAVGLGNAAQNAITSSQIDAMHNAMAREHNSHTSNRMHNFNFEELENGWLIIFKGKKWMVNDLEELSQRVVAIMVEQRLEK